MDAKRALDYVKGSFSQAEAEKLFEGLSIPDRSLEMLDFASLFFFIGMRVALKKSVKDMSHVTNELNEDLLEIDRDITMVGE